MRSSKRLRPVVDVAEIDERRAAGAFAATQQRLSDYQQRLDSLLAARGDYVTAAGTPSANAISARSLGSTRSFIARLDSAIAELGTQCALQRERCDKARRQWLQARSRVQALDGIVSRHQRSERALMHSREQGESDDFAGARHFSGTGG